MDALSRKLHTLESNVLEFPPADDDITLHIGNRDEQLLHHRAQQIRTSIKDEAQAIVDSGTSPEEQNEAAKDLIRKLTDQESDILEQSYQFLLYRLQRLVYTWFAAAYPKGEDHRVALRILWFFSEMQKFNHACLIEDYEWKHNRNEDSPDFDDFAWWDTVDAKIKAIYPIGAFSEKSFEEYERIHDELVTRKIVAYYDAHPVEREALLESPKINLEKETHG